MRGLLATGAIACALWGCAKEIDREEPEMVDEIMTHCVAEHPTTAAESASLLAESGASGACSADDGACQASTGCKGTKEGRVCAPAQVISADAALCIADAVGLASGLHGLEVRMAYDNRLRRIVWEVENTLADPDGGTARGGGLSIDAITGRVLDEFGWSQTP